MKERREVRAREMVEDIRAGKTDSELLEKYRLSEKGLASVMKRLLDAGLMESSELKNRLALFQQTASIPVPRKEPRCYPVFAILIHELDDLATDYYIQDLSLKGFRISGMLSKVGDVRTFLIQADEFVDVFPLSFDAQCRWVKADSNINEYSAGFQIVKISEGNLNELKQIIKHMTVSEDQASEDDDD